MAQDTRKDPRAKVLSMTVRYKSATVDQFIEQHSHDVSRGGIYIKTPSPFPPGTLLKFEIRIQDEQSVLSGVGRVVWKREPSEASGDSPAGMGVKFIKIEEKHKDLIARLVDSQGGKVSAFDAGVDGGAAAAKEAATAAVAALAESAKQQVESKPAAKRVSTMLGLGAIGKADAKKAEPEEKKAEPEEKKDESFFPKSSGVTEQRPAEERTVMKQAAELLQQALSEAGGSLSDVAPDEPKVVEGKSEARAAEPKEESKKENGASSAVALAKTTPIDEEDVPAAKAKSKEPAADVDDKPVAASPKDDEKPAPKAAVKAESKLEPKAPPPVAARVVEPEKSSGSTKFVILGLALAAIVAVAYFVVNQNNGTTAQTGTATNSAPKKELTPVMTMSTEASPSRDTASAASPTPPPSTEASTPASATTSAAPAASSAPVPAKTTEPTSKPTAPVTPPTTPVTFPTTPATTPKPPNTTPKPPPTAPPTTPKPPDTSTYGI